MNWSELERLRSRFLAESFSAVSHYWENTELIAEYDSTFAARIGWKWDAVFSELKQRGWSPPKQSHQILDWGCGTGIAARRYLSHLDAQGRSSVSEVLLHDKSTECAKFAAAKISEIDGAIKYRLGSADKSSSTPLVLLLSHVINELEPEGLKVLGEVCQRATQILWVEPGSFEVSRKLIEQRETLINEFSVFAPCTHQNACGMLSKENAQHWCHHFASPPSFIFQDPFWSEFARRLKIDLHSLPVSFLVLQRKNAAAPELKESNSRVIGRPRLYKGNGKFLICNEDGVKDTLLPEKSHRKLFKSYKSDQFWQPL